MSPDEIRQLLNRARQAQARSDDHAWKAADSDHDYDRDHQYQREREYADQARALRAQIHQALLENPGALTPEELRDLPPPPQHPPSEHAPQVMHGDTIPEALIAMGTSTGELQAQLARRLQMCQERRS
jgi:hypothetical protein